MISMSWEDGSDDGGLPITGYRVQVSKDISMVNPFNDIAYPTKKAKVGQLQKDQLYFLTVKAINLMGESLPSQLIQARAEIWSEPPGPPTIRNDQLVTDNTKIGV